MDLPTLAARLEAVISDVETDLRRTMPHCEPWRVRDTSGRYILLDALVALADVKARVG